MSEQYRLLTYDDAAKLLHVRWEAVRELVETGQLRAVRIGARYRIPIGALEQLHGRLPAPPPGVSTGVSNLRRMPRRGGGAGE